MKLSKKQNNALDRAMVYLADAINFIQSDDVHVYVNFSINGNEHTKINKEYGGKLQYLDCALERLKRLRETTY